MAYLVEDKIQSFTSIRVSVANISQYRKREDPKGEV